MTRRGSATAALAMILTIGMGLSLLAAERGTFILRNGERQSGVLSAHTESRANLLFGKFTLGDMPGGTGNLREREYPQDQVVAIDFAGGRPSGDELSQLNRMEGQPHLLVLRGGRVVRGRFVNIIGGDTVVFSNQNYPVRDVARVYLDIAAVKTIFNVPPDRAERRDDRSSDRDRYSDRDRRPGRDRDEDRGGPGIAVPARRQWTDTGISVRPGDRIAFQASGRISVSDDDRNGCDPEGQPGRRTFRRNYPVPDAPVGALIGRVGNGRPFEIGASTRPFTFEESGVLYLGVNDDMVEDNRGAFRVEISLLGRGR